jgi:hypothetical protein
MRFRYSEYLSVKFMVMKKIALALALISPFCFLSAQKIPAVDAYYPMLRNSFVADNAYRTTGFVEQYWRIAGNKGFNETIQHVENILQKAGYIKEVNGEADGPLTYRIETRKMNRPTWEPVSASVTIAGDNKPLLESSTNRNMITIYSASTSAAGEEGEVVYVGEGRNTSFEGKDVKGKIVFAETSPASVYTKAIQLGAIGVIAYSMPAYTQPEKNRHSIQFRNIPYKDSANQKWAIMLSYDAKEKLKAAMEKGPVRLKVQVTTKIYPSEELTIVANARGSVKPDERFVFSAHIQEPGANDNATGVGTLAEMARMTASLIREKKYQPQRTITFLWGDEIVSTGRYIKDDPDRAKGIKWGLSLDMVGEDITKTTGTFLIEKMPDPSAIWTRGNDKHTEWGGSVLKESDMFPHYFNDFLLDRCRQQARSNGWVVNTNPFEGGSDHTPFLQAKIPGLLMWHFTDQFYHTDGDRLDKVSAEEMKNVGVSGLAAAFTLCAADTKTTIGLIDEITVNALERIKTEFALSKTALVNGSTIDKEKHILETWESWYEGALSKMNEINVAGDNSEIQQKIAGAQNEIRKNTSDLLALLAK